MATKRVVAFWLVPAPPAKQLFAALIRILADELEAPLFEPHVTLFTSAMRPAKARKILKMIQGAPVRLPVGRVNHSRTFTKALFLRFGGRTRLSALLKQFGQIMDERILPPADPHLSLCYKRLPVSVKRELAAVMRFHFKSVSFDIIKAVHCPLPTKNARDVRGWRPIGTCRLGR